jgi:beta-glucosidase
MHSADAGVEAEVDGLLEKLTLDEKLSLLDGDWPFWSGIRELGVRGGYHRHPWNAGVIPRVGIHGVRFIDGPRGVVLEGGATTFPVTMARGATWDVELETRVGDAIGQELQALGGNLYGGVCINLLRHPAWGRAQETYGEDPLHLGFLGAALTRGVQRRAMACVKHFACNSIENARFSVDVRVAPRPLHEIYLRHFKEVVDAGVACVMSAYNSVNGAWCGENGHLLTSVLKERWGFRGFVLTDFMMGMRDAERAALAGQDIEMPFQMHFHTFLPGLVADGSVPMARVDDAARRILRQQLLLGRPRDIPKSVLGCDAHRALAREVAQKSIVLLRNEGDVLPLAGSERIALIGRLADKANLGDRGSSDGRPRHVVTPLAGLRSALGDAASLTYEPGASLDAARTAARDADVAVVVVGYTYRDEGEFLVPPDFTPFAHGIPKPGPLRWLFGPHFMRPWWGRLFTWLSRLGTPKRATDFGMGGDRASLTLSAADEALIHAVAESNPRSVVVVMAGSAVVMEAWKERVPGILMLWYPGMEGGHALADVLLGKVSPGGRMPFATPTSAAHLPHFDREAREITYDLWHGYRKLDRDGVSAAFPFGFGLSYTGFAFSDLTLDRGELRAEDTLTLELEVRNTGDRAADCVVQVYASALDSAVERARKTLVAFTRTPLSAATSRSISIPVRARDLAYFDEARDDFVVEPIEYELQVARHADDADALRARFRVIA